MKVKKAENKNQLRICDLEVGQCFRFVDDCRGDICMKVDFYKESDNTYVDLRTGKVETAGELADVTFVDGTFVEAKKTGE